MNRIRQTHLIWLIAVTIFLANAQSPASAVPILVTSRAAQAADDTVDWGQFGAEPTQISSGDVATSANGNLVTISQSPSGNFVRWDQGSAWLGAFSPGDALLYNGATGVITFAFNTPVAGAGIQIEDSFTGPFAVTIRAFDAGNNLLAEFLNVPGVSQGGSNVGDGSAPYFGVLDNSATISSLQFSSVGTSPMNPNAIVFNAMSINSTGVPEINAGAASIPLACVLIVGFLLGDGRRRGAATH